MRRTGKILFIISLITVIAGGALLGVRFLTGSDIRVLTVEEIEAMPSVETTYRSINNWGTVENTSFKGVPLHELLWECGVEDDEAHVKVIAPDGYFWPAVGTRLYLEDLRKANQEGLSTVIAFEMDGKALDPEPDGTGPLRFVMPQENEDHVNKPSWVFNVRMIEVGLEGEAEAGAPDAAEVPLGQLWLSGNVPTSYGFPLWPGILLLALGVTLALAVVVVEAAGTKRGSSAGAAAVVIVALLVAATLSPVSGGAGADTCGRGAFTFSTAELMSMPATSGNYTFLKSQPPYTYYEKEYTGVALSYLLDEKLNLQPGAGSIVVKASDGYAVTLSVSQVRKTYPGGPKVIVAYRSGGSNLVGDEGPLRLIVPQESPGDIDHGGDSNTPLCARMVNAVEVTPSSPGEAPGSIPAGSLAVYGAVAQPPPPPQPAPQPQTPAPAATEPGSQPEAQQQAAAPQPVPAPEAAAVDSQVVVSLGKLLVWIAVKSLQAVGIVACFIPMVVIFR